jgi:hypothetical protein
VVGTTTATAVNGVARFADVGIGGLLGSYTLTFSSSALSSASQSVTITSAGNKVGMILTPTTASIGVGASQELTAYYRDAAGNLTAADGVIGLTYTASDPAVVSVSSTVAVMGVPKIATLTGVAMGAATVTASSGYGYSATATITVRGPSSLTWTGAVDKYWKNAGNWAEQSSPANGDRLVFPAGAIRKTMEDNVAFAGLNGIESLTLMGDGYSLDGQVALPIRSLITQSSGNGISLSAPIKLLGNASIHTDCCSLAIVSSIDLNGFNLNIDGYNTVVTGVISGVGNVTLAKNTVSLRADNTYMGTTTVATWAGIFGFQPPTDVTVSPAGQLYGGGRVRDLTVSGMLAPGTSSPCCNSTNGVGRFEVANLRFESGASFSRVDISGLAPGTGYDQVRAGVSVTLNNATLELAPLQSYVPPVGTVLTIIDNFGTYPVSGTFRGLAEGATITLNSAFTFRISYVGGDGNDVTLTRIS